MKIIVADGISSSSNDASCVELYNKARPFTKTSPNEARRTIIALGKTQRLGLSYIKEEEKKWVEQKSKLKKI